MSEQKPIEAGKAPPLSEAGGSAPSYKVWHAEYDWRGGWGAYEEKQCVVVAETKSAALGWVLMEHKDTDGADWTITEIKTSEAGVTYISSRSS